MEREGAIEWKCAAKNCPYVITRKVDDVYTEKNKVCAIRRHWFAKHPKLKWVAVKGKANKTTGSLGKKLAREKDSRRADKLLAAGMRGGHQIEAIPVPTAKRNSAACRKFLNCKKCWWTACCNRSVRRSSNSKSWDKYLNINLSMPLLGKGKKHQMCHGDGKALMANWGCPQQGESSAATSSKTKVEECSAKESCRGAHLLAASTKEILFVVGSWKKSNTESKRQLEMLIKMLEAKVTMCKSLDEPECGKAVRDSALDRASKNLKELAEVVKRLRY